MKYFVVSDVHGYYNLMKEALDKAGFDATNPNHTLISCGDLLDRGNQAEDCLKFVLGLPRKILVCGNHECMMEEAIIRQKFLAHDESNGAVDTARQLTHTTLPDVAVLQMRDCKLYNDYINELMFYAEIGNHIFVHGWIPCNQVSKTKTPQYKYVDFWRDANVESWMGAMWINGMDAWWQGVKEEGKTIVCGHWHSSWGHAHIHNICREWDNKYSTNPEHRVFHSEPFVDEGIIAIDACTAYSHKVNCYVFEEEGDSNEQE